MLLQYPNTFGHISDYAALAEKARANDVRVVVASDLLALCVLRPPGEWGADAVCGNTQRFGVPLGYGGPHAAFLATNESNKRRIPGRIIGVSRDSRGQPALRMAMQTREQHIRRDKATSPTSAPRRPSSPTPPPPTPSTTGPTASDASPRRSTRPHVPSPPAVQQLGLTVVHRPPSSTPCTCSVEGGAEQATTRRRRRRASTCRQGGRRQPDGGVRRDHRRASALDALLGVFASVVGPGS